ncbi:MAG: SOS-response transcriptional repressor [Gammaproteobacteria bacterium]|jgi:SOS-response transcriptional repressor LexA|nr:SOS-response transcriptional repressor [Gammaproteobacteria bacterium]
MIKNLKNKVLKRKRVLHKNINFLLNKFGIDTKILSLETKIPLPTLFRIKKENNNPTLSTLEPIAEFFRIELNDLLYEDIASDEYQNKRKIGVIQYVPVMKLSEAKTWPIDYKTKTYIGTVGNLNKGSFGIEIDTDSLVPIFYRGSVVVIDPAIQPKDMDYIFCLIENDPVPLFRQYFTEGSHHFLKPLNLTYGEMVNTNKFKAVGVIVKSIENYR